MSNLIHRSLMGNVSNSGNGGESFYFTTEETDTWLRETYVDSEVATFIWELWTNNMVVNEAGDGYVNEDTLNLYPVYIDGSKIISVLRVGTITDHYDILLETYDQYNYTIPCSYWFMDGYIRIWDDD